MANSISPTNVNKPADNKNTKNAYSDLWSPDNNLGTNCGSTRSHITGFYQISTNSALSKQNLYFLYTCFQIYHPPFVIFFLTTIADLSQNIFLSNIDINIEFNRILISFFFFPFFFLLFSFASISSFVNFM